MVAPGAHAVLLVDQAGWHLSARLVIPTNITILPMPPKSPELNPVENIWQFMRDNWLSNRVFKSYDDLVDHCCEAWNKLVDHQNGKSCRPHTSPTRKQPTAAPLWERLRRCVLEGKLERAKGLEPSTPTLARSCSTTELHPHPRWRRTLAVNGRPMPNADRECNSPRAVRCHADHPISLTNGTNRSETTPKRGLSSPQAPRLEPKIRLPARRGAIRAIFRTSLPTSPAEWSRTGSGPTTRKTPAD